MLITKRFLLSEEFSKSVIYSVAVGGAIFFVILIRIYEQLSENNVKYKNPRFWKGAQKIN
jgi:hypothetical protein